MGWPRCPHLPVHRELSCDIAGGGREWAPYGRHLDGAEEPGANRRRPAAAGRAPPQAVLDRITALAAELLEVPMVLVTLIEPDRQVFLSSWGLPGSIRSQSQGETSADYSICQYAVGSRRPLIVGDTATDPVLATNRAVTELGVAAYAGIPLVTPTVHAVGTLCALDVVAQEWRDDQMALLADLAKLLEDEIRLHHLEARLAFEQQWGGVQPTSWRGV